MAPSPTSIWNVWSIQSLATKAMASGLKRTQNVDGNAGRMVVEPALVTFKQKALRAALRVTCHQRTVPLTTACVPAE